MCNVKDMLLINNNNNNISYYKTNSDFFTLLTHIVTQRFAVVALRVHTPCHATLIHIGTFKHCLTRLKACEEVKLAKKSEMERFLVDCLMIVCSSVNFMQTSPSYWSRVNNYHLFDMVIFFAPKKTPSRTCTTQFRAIGAPWMFLGAIIMLMESFASGRYDWMNGIRFLDKTGNLSSRRCSKGNEMAN